MSLPDIALYTFDSISDAGAADVRSVECDVFHSIFNIYDLTQNPDIMVAVPDFETSNLDPSEGSLTSLNSANNKQQENDVCRKQSTPTTTINALKTKKKVPKVRTALTPF